MKIIISKIDPNLELAETDYTSLVSWEAATQDEGEDSLAVAVIHPASDAEYQYLIDALDLKLEQLIQNYLLVHSNGKVLAFKVDEDFMHCSYGQGFFDKSATSLRGYEETIKRFVSDKFSQYQSKVFLCHASEDKSDVLQPLIMALDEERINFWVDSVSIKLGDSITEKVSQGINQSDYFVIVLSKSFVGKPWPERELNAILNLDIAPGKRRIIPVLIGSAEERREILLSYPLLNDVAHFVWKNNPVDFISLFKERLGRDVREQ